MVPLRLIARIVNRARSAHTRAAYRAAVAEIEAIVERHPRLIEVEALLFLLRLRAETAPRRRGGFLGSTSAACSGARG